MQNGFILVASSKYAYYERALRCGESLRRYYPDASITLFTHEEWIDDRAQIFNALEVSIPRNNRAKLWALSRSPYDLTMYMDADSHVCHEDIRTVFGTIGDSDIVMGKVRDYAHDVCEFPAGRLTLHCGMFVYRRNEITTELFDKWYDLYLQQQQDWDLDPAGYPPELLRPYDTFTFWRLLNLEGYRDRVRIAIWDDDARWNFHGYDEAELNGKPVVVLHQSIERGISHERDIVSQSFTAS